MSKTLCEFCSKMCNGCKYIRSFTILTINGNIITRYTPIEGWKIERSKSGIKVIDCPEFKRDCITRRQITELEGISDKTYDRHKERLIKKYEEQGYRLYK